jgi:hypothetical protein
LTLDALSFGREKDGEPMSDFGKGDIQELEELVIFDGDCGTELTGLCNFPVFCWSLVVLALCPSD